MYSIGIMTTQLTSEQHYFTELAKAAHKKQIKIFRFSPSQIDSKNKVIQGEEFHSIQKLWQPAQFQIPDFVYDRSFHGLVRETSESSKNINWLKKHTQFLGYGLPGKWEVYEVLSKVPMLQAFLPATFQAENPNNIQKKLDEYERIMLKPKYGSGGSRIYLLTKGKNGTLVTMTKHENKYERLFHNQEQLHKWLSSLLDKYQFLIQPYLELSNSNNEPFDLRILVQKNKENMWFEQGRGLRVGKQDCITSNMATGGKSKSYDGFINSLLPQEEKYLEQMIQHILEILPTELESSFNRLFELGIDLGIDRENRIWILDINSKPGRKLIETLEPQKRQDLYLAPLNYCEFLAEQFTKVGET